MEKKEWHVEELITFVRSHANEEQRKPMEAYMHNQFRFLGIPSPERKQIIRQFFSQVEWPSASQWLADCRTLFFQPEREFQYIAMELAFRGKKHLTIDDLQEWYKWMHHQPWWDTIDFIAPKLVGAVVLQDRIKGEEIMQQWLTDDSFWIKRAALLHQLKYKEQMNEDFLFYAIDQLHTSTEFFIEKAIGWVLREYAKTNPLVVQKYVATHPLRPLSKREALKHVGALASN